MGNTPRNNPDSRMALSVLSQGIAFVPGSAVPLQPSTRVAAASNIVAEEKMRFSYAPEGMGKEYVNQPRKPLSEYVGASVEFCAFPGAPDEPVAWDPMRFSELYKVSGNNPDVAWLREAELKHGRRVQPCVPGLAAWLHLQLSQRPWCASVEARPVQLEASVGKAPTRAAESAGL